MAHRKRGRKCEPNWKSDIADAIQSARQDATYVPPNRCEPYGKRRVFPLLDHLVADRLHDDELCHGKVRYVPDTQKQDTFDEIVREYCEKIEMSTTISSLSYWSLEAITSYLQYMDVEDVKYVLSLLPPEVTTVFSAMATRKGAVTDDNIRIFSNSNVKFLILGGRGVSDCALNAIMPTVIPKDISPATDWEDIDVEDTEFFTTCGCFHLERVALLSTRLTTSAVLKLVQSPYSKLESIDVCGISGFDSGCTNSNIVTIDSDQLHELSDKGNVNAIQLV